MAESNRAVRAASELARIQAFFPLMSMLGNRWAALRPFDGRTVLLNMHLTTLTAALVRELALGGGTWVVLAADEATTDQGVVDLLRAQGLEVITRGGREDPMQQALAHGPTLAVDVGGGLLAALSDRYSDAGQQITGAVEVTQSGVTRLRDLDPPFAWINVNDGRLKRGVENRHGVGEGLWQAAATLTGMHLAGRRVGVIGYGPVGHGVAAYAKAAGASVEVVETDPVRRLLAHYDGYPTPPLAQALGRVGIAVTCTGHAGAVTLANLDGCRDGLVLLNAGHGGDEIDVSGIVAAAEGIDQVTDHVVRYTLPGKRTVVLLAGGHPLNIVANSGSPEPVLLHFAVVGLTLEWLAGLALPSGEHAVPESIERDAATMALKALGQAHG